MQEPNAQVIAGLEAAVSASPDNHDLRAHLAGLLLAANRPADAMQHASTILKALPDHLAALEVGMRSAQALRAKAPGKQVALTRPAEPEPQRDEAEEDSVETAAGKVVPLRVLQGGIPDDGWRVEQADLKLADVAGLDAVKRRLELSIFALLRHSEMREYFGRSIKGGLLLYGPPGCGKTFVARATAGEMGARFLAVGLSDVLDMYLGQSERKLHELFETARRNAPCVLFIDEIDALGRKRSLQRNSSERNLVNQLLSEMDSIAANNQGIFVLGATNHLWDVDTALRRPGRFDRVIFVAPPDATARQAILELHTRDRTLQGVDWSAIVSKTDGFSGADLAHLCDTAAERAMEESIQSGRMRPIQGKDFTAALKDVKPSTRPWMETARDYAMFANEGGSYDDLLEYLRSVRMM